MQTLRTLEALEREGLLTPDPRLAAAAQSMAIGTTWNSSSSSPAGAIRNSMKRCCSPNMGRRAAFTRSPPGRLQIYVFFWPGSEYNIVYDFVNNKFAPPKRPDDKERRFITCHFAGAGDCGGHRHEH